MLFRCQNFMFSDFTILRNIRCCPSNPPPPFPENKYYLFEMIFLTDSSKIFELNQSENVKLLYVICKVNSNYCKPTEFYLQRFSTIFKCTAPKYRAIDTLALYKCVKKRLFFCPGISWCTKKTSYCKFI